MIIYKKATGGRLTTVQKELLNEVNGLIRALPSKDKKKFKDLVVNNDKDLQNLYSKLTNGESVIDLKPQNEDSLKVVEPIKEPIPQPMSTNAKQEVPDFFSPLDKPAIQRSYTETPANQSMADIPEPQFTQGLSTEDTEAPDIENLGPTNPSPTPQPNTQPNTQHPSSPPPQQNEPVNELDAKEKRMAAKQLVDIALEAYATAHTFAANFAKMDENKLMEKVATGEIDPEISFPIDEKGTTTNALEFFQGFNEQAQEAFTYDPEFGDKVRPAMQRVFEKKGLGLSDEQYLLGMFGKDIAIKVSMLVSMKKTQKMMLNMFVSMKQSQVTEQYTAEQNISSVKPDSIINPPKQEEEPQQLTPDQVEDAIIEN